MNVMHTPTLAKNDTLGQKSVNCVGNHDLGTAFHTNDHFMLHVPVGYILQVSVLADPHFFTAYIGAFFKFCKHNRFSQSTMSINVHIWEKNCFHSVSEWYNINIKIKEKQQFKCKMHKSQECGNPASCMNDLFLPGCRVGDRDTACTAKKRRVRLTDTNRRIKNTRW